MTERIYLPGLENRWMNSENAGCASALSAYSAPLVSFLVDPSSMPEEQKSRIFNGSFNEGGFAEENLI
jgi:hypothetical protein